MNSPARFVVASVSVTALLSACGSTGEWVRPRTVTASVADSPDGSWDIVPWHASVVVRFLFAGRLGATWAAHSADHSAPDPAMEIYADGELVCSGAVQKNASTATWRGATLACQPFFVTSNTAWRIRFVDADLACDDPIAECEAEGVPELDDDGSVEPGTFACRGAIAGLALKLELGSPEPRPDSAAPSPALRARRRPAFCPGDKPDKHLPRVDCSVQMRRLHSSMAFGEAEPSRAQNGQDQSSALQSSWVTSHSSVLDES